MRKKLTKAERMVDEQMLALIEWAEGGGWCPLGRDEATRTAAKLLEKRGVIQLNDLINVYRLTPKEK